MAGKNKLLKGARMYVGGYDLSGDQMGIGSLLNSFGEVDLTAWDETCKNYISDGVRQVGIRGFKAFMNDNTSKSMTSLKNNPAASVVTLAIGSGGSAPAASDMAYILPPVQVSDLASFESSVGILTADFIPDQSQYDADYGTPWGRVLYPLTSIGTTTTGTIVNFGAAGTTGYTAILQVTATSSGDFAFIIEQSATGSYGGEEDTLVTFSADGSAITSEFTAVSGAVKQYQRFKATRTAGTISVFCAIALNGLA